MKRSILIVDDEYGLADVIAEMLLDGGYETAIAINGRLALAAMAQRRPDLVLSDVMMPVMDGPALLRAMRADPVLRELPVILMTAVPEALPRDRLTLHQATLYKPFPPQELFTAVARLLGQPPRDRS